MTGSGALLRQCPLLLPQNREGTAYEGFVTAQVPEPAPPLGRRPSHRVSLPPPPTRPAPALALSKACAGGRLPSAGRGRGGGGAGGGRFPPRPFAERGAAGFVKQETPGRGAGGRDGVAGHLGSRRLPAPGSLPCAVRGLWRGGQAAIPRVCAVCARGIALLAARSR